MLLKAFSVNLRGSLSVCSPLCCVSNQIPTITRSKLLQKSSNIKTSFYRSASRYSNGNASTNVLKQNDSKKNESVPNQSETKLSQHEIDILNQDPDNFGTLSSFEPLTVNETQHKDDESSSSTNAAHTGDDESQACSTHSTDHTPTKRQTIQHYEAVMKDLFQKGNVLEAIELFETEVLQKNRMHAPIRIYEWLIEECIRLYEFTKAIDIYDQMIGRKLTVSSGIFEKLVLAYEQTNMNVGKLNNIQKVMSKNHIQLNANMYNAMVRIYARSTQWQTALTLADEMKANAMTYDLDTINALFECFSRDKDNGFYRSIELWHEMHRFNYTPNVSTFNGFLKCMKKCELNNVDKLKRMIETIRMQCTTHSSEEIIEDGRPNLLRTPPYIGYLFPMEQVERPEHRLLISGGLTNLLNEFNRHDIIPTLETITLLLEIVPNTFVAHQKVIGLLNKHHMKPDLEIFNILLTKNCQAQNFGNAMEIIEMMYAADIEVDLVSYGLLAMSCTNKGDAEDYFTLLAEKNVTLDVDILNAMLKNACASKDNDFVISILRKMEQKQIEPTENSIRMVDEYHTREFRNLRSYRVASKKMRNECFKLTRECRHWKKHFRNDQPKEFTSKSYARKENSKHYKKPRPIDDSQAKIPNEIAPNA